MNFINALSINGRIENGGRIVHVINGDDPAGAASKTLCGIRVGEITWGKTDLELIGCLKCRKIAIRQTAQDEERKKELLP